MARGCRGWQTAKVEGVTSPSTLPLLPFMPLTKPRPSHAASSRSLRRSKKYAPKSNTGSKKRAANLSPPTTGKSSWSTPLTPTSASGMMEKTEMCGSPQQPFNHACDLTAHVTFMPVPTNSLFVSSTPPHSCA